MIMEPEHNIPPTLEDKILFLYLLAKMPQQRLTTIESQKMVFFVKSQAYHDHELLFRIKFFKDAKGPNSQHVYDIRSEFNIANLGRIQTAQSPFSYRFTIANPPPVTQYLYLAEGAELLLDWIQSYAFDEPWAFDRIDAAVKKYGGLPWKTRQKLVYAIEVNGRTVAQYNLTEPFEMPSRIEWPTFNIPAKSRPFLEALFDPTRRIQMKEERDKRFCYKATLSVLREDWNTDGDNYE